MSLRQKAIKGVFWSVIQKWGSQLISTGVFLFLARLLGPEAFGLVALAGVYIAFVRLFMDQGFSQAIVQREELELEHLDTAFWTSLLFGTTLTTVSIAGAGFIAQIFGEPQLAPVIRFLSLNLVIGSLNSVQGAILTRDFQFKSLAMRSLTATGISGIIGIILAMNSFGVWSLVAKELVFSFVGVLLLWRVSDWRPGFRISLEHFRELFAFGVNIMGFNFVNFFNRKSDNLLIGYYLGATALGYYTVAYRLLIIVTQLMNSATSKVALPTFSRMQTQPQKMRSAFYKVTKMTSFVSFPIFIGMSALAPEIVQVLFGEEWLPSIPVMRVLSLIGVLHSVQFFNGTVLLAMNKPSWRLWAGTFIAICNVVGFFIVVNWGITAVAVSYVIIGYLTAPIFLFLVKKTINISFKDYFLQYSTPILSSFGMVMCIFILKNIFSDSIEEYFLLLIYAFFGAMIYLSVFSLLSPKAFGQVYALVRAYNK